MGGAIRRGLVARRPAGDGAMGRALAARWLLRGFLGGWIGRALTARRWPAGCWIWRALAASRWLVNGGAMGRALTTRRWPAGRAVWQALASRQWSRIPLAFFLAVCMLWLGTGCAQRIPGVAEGTPLAGEPRKLQVVATIFPQYDFARQIAGGLAEVRMLLPPGAESHTFEPTPGDMLVVLDADVFLYTGEAMEPWAARILAGADSGTLRVVDVTYGIALDTDEDEGDMLGGEEAHHDHEPDAHVWLDPTLAAVMAGNIAEALKEADPANAEAYRQNADAYIAELLRLDADFAAAVAAGQRDTLVFGGKFAYHYFLSRYHLKHVSAYDSCSTEAEPGMRRIAQVLAYMREHGTPVIYYEELAEPKVARAIAEETGAKLLLFATAHTVSKEAMESGASYLSIMRDNLENVKAGLN